MTFISLSKKTKRTSLFIFALFHLCIILLSTFISDYSTAKEYFTEEDVLKTEKVKTDAIEKSVSALLNLPLISPYAIIAGTDAGYGFFAPNVASSYVVECIVKDSSGNNAQRQYFPALKTHEGMLRYETLVSGFQERMKALRKSKSVTLYTRLLDIMLKSIGHHMLDSVNGKMGMQATVTLYLYSFPSLNKYISGNQNPKLISLVSFDITKKINIPKDLARK